MKNYWSNDEIEFLKKEYISGKKIKVIASELGRSYSATNKTISRVLGAARKRKVVYPIEKKQNSNKKKQYIKILENRKKYFVENVDFSTIKEYLSSKGYNVIKFYGSISNIRAPKNEVFVVQNQPMTKLNVLLIANRIRVEEKLPIFYLPEVV